MKTIKTPSRQPRVIPPWTTRARANRYVNLDQDEYYYQRGEMELPTDDPSYALAESSDNQSTSDMPVGQVVVKEDDDDDQEIVVDAIVVDGEGESGMEAEHVDDQLDDQVDYDELYGQGAYPPEEVNSLFVLGSEVSKHPWNTNEEIANFFIANPSLNNPIDVRELAAMAKTATPDINYQLIVGLGSLVNGMKREMTVLKVEMNALRDMVTSKQDMGNTKRRFSAMNSVRHQWRITPQPPLREVDLVQTARTIDFTRGTKKPLSNKDGITRFVKTILELLIPEELARNYTVRERSHRRNGLKDIGEHAKEQIIGCVLDLLGLYEIEELDTQGRVDRAHFTNVVNHAMRMSLIDLRRSEPRRILGNADYSQSFIE